MTTEKEFKTTVEKYSAVEYVNLGERDTDTVWVYLYPDGDNLLYGHQVAEIDAMSEKFTISVSDNFTMITVTL